MLDAPRRRYYNKRAGFAPAYTPRCCAVGSARGLGPRGRRFESCHLDQQNTVDSLESTVRVSTNPSSASSKTGVCSEKWKNERYNTEKTVRVSIPPYPFCILFQIHGSKFKLHPVRYLSQACVSSMSQTMLLFCICKDTFNRLFPSPVHPLVDRSVTGIVGQFFIVFPDTLGRPLSAQYNGSTIS